MTFTPDQWLILLLAFVLGLVLGMALLASPKWKGRYREESARREALERDLRDDRERWASREKEWREQDSLRGAAAKDRDRDGVRDDRPL